MTDLIDKAKKIAFSVHKNQVDKLGVPYLAHVFDVASRVETFGEDYKIVALLHDAIEDAQSSDFKKNIEMDVKIYFSSSICDAVFAITKNDNEDYFKEYLPAVRENEIARAVKIADSSHNLSKSHLIDDAGLKNKLREKYIKVLNYLGVEGSEQEIDIIYSNKKWRVKL